MNVFKKGVFKKGDKVLVKPGGRSTSAIKLVNRICIVKSYHPDLHGGTDISFYHLYEESELKELGGVWPDELELAVVVQVMLVEELIKKANEGNAAIRALKTIPNVQTRWFKESQWKALGPSVGNAEYRLNKPKFEPFKLSIGNISLDVRMSENQDKYNRDVVLIGCKSVILDELVIVIKQYLDGYSKPIHVTGLEDKLYPSKDGLDTERDGKVSWDELERVYKILRG